MMASGADCGSSAVLGTRKVSSIMSLAHRPHGRVCEGGWRQSFRGKYEVYLRSGAARQVLAELSGVDSDGGRLAEFRKTVEVSIREHALRPHRVAPP